MDELSANRAFIQVVECGSLSAAARSLGTSIASVSRQVGSLEAGLGVRLLNRTTRQHALTEAGQLYYGEIVKIVRNLETLKSEVSSYQSAIKGRLRVHLRVSVGNEVIVPALPRFLAANPQVELDVALTDERVDLVAHGVDVAVWLGSLEDSSLIARRLSQSRRVLCASPAYLQARGYPKAPEDLAMHNCLVYRAAHYDNHWRLKKDGVTSEVIVSGNLQTSSSAVLFTSALSGLGIALVQAWVARDATARGDLVPVLESYQASPTEADVALFAVYPGRHRVSPKTRAFVDFLVELFQSPK